MHYPRKYLHDPKYMLQSLIESQQFIQNPIQCLAISHIPAFRNNNEDSCDNPSNEERDENGLKKDHILNLSQSRLLNPNLAIKDFADDVALLILDNPRGILVRVGGLNTIDRLTHTIAFAIGILVDLRICKQLPGSKVTMMHAVENNAHALVSCNQSGSTNNQSDGSETVPAPADVAEGD